MNRKPTEAETENIAAVTAELSFCIIAVDESLWPRGYRFDAFGGFPGWWTFCAQAGAAFHDVFEPALEDVDWVNCVTEYAGAVWQRVDDCKGPILQDELEALAKAVLAASS